MSWSPHYREIHDNNIDPDDGNSWLCSVCDLPIFSTPFIKSDDDDSSSGKLEVMHDECANVPEELSGSVTHPGWPLILRNNDVRSVCDACFGVIGGTKFYQCREGDPVGYCLQKFDVLCALPMRIRMLHRSHEHRLTAIHAASASFICGACGTRHDHDQPLSVSKSAVCYVCHACGFWIRPRCASLPNAIVLQHHDDSNSKQYHEHPLVLNYRLPRAQKSYHLFQELAVDRKCAICQRLIESVGDYSCIKCQNYHVHIMCAVSKPKTFKPLLIREARLPDLIRLPVPNEHTSLIRYIADNTVSTTASLTSSGSRDHHDDDKLRQLHEHPLIFHAHDNEDDDDQRRVCNACVQFIISSPFYKCPICPDFILHDCCAHLPRTFTQHPAHKIDHRLSLLPKPPGKYFMSNVIIHTSCCYSTNGFIYSCNDCKLRMDVLCALMPASITHDAHSKAHILYSNFVYSRRRCDCCGGVVGGIYRENNLYYECRTCPNFRLHSKCAQLPNTVSHTYDQHPLKLITKTTISKLSESSSTSTHLDVPVYSNNQQQKVVLLCEICEKDIDNKWWYYGCDECDQWFHIRCIPYLDEVKKIKFGGNVRVKCHDCPLTLIRGITVHCSHCGYCGQTFGDHNNLAFECSECDFTIHFGCARKNVKEDVDNKFTGAGRAWPGRDS